MNTESRQIKYQHKMKAEGRCQLCGSPAKVKGVKVYAHCENHHNNKISYGRANRQPSTQRCSICGELGHTKPLCERRDDV